MSACHLTAAITVLLSDLLLPLRLIFVAPIILSYALYLRDRLRTFTIRSGGVWRFSLPALILSGHIVRLDYLGETLEMQVPSVVYFGEFLMVLSLRPDKEIEETRAAARRNYLVLWPDSMRSHEDRRLRRYLRFDLPTALSSRDVSN